MQGSALLKHIVKRIIPSWRRPTLREILAGRYLKGNGIEIGALHNPLKVPSCARVKYVDRLSVDELRIQYPELKRNPFVKVDIIDDGESLKKIEPGSLDFLIANHFLEHCENPIAAFESFLRALKNEGIIYLAAPDKRFTFDKKRLDTPLEHMVKDYRQGPEWSRQAHFQEWGALVDKTFINDPLRDAAILKSSNYSIHYHVWTSFGLLELMVFLRQNLNFSFELLEFVVSGEECIFIIKKVI